jgi:predicted TIM-barrel enzyme
MKRLLAPAALALLLSACAHVDYVGRTYPPTNKVDLFFDEREVGQDYEVMGEVLARANDLVSAEKLQAKIVEKAGEKGADAVVITGLERYKTGESTSYEESTKERKRGTVTTGTTSTTETNEKVVKAVFLKYKERLGAP